MPAPSPRRRRRLRVDGARRRLLLAHLLLLSLSLLATVLVVRDVLVAGVESRIEQGLRQEVLELERLVGADGPATGEPSGDDVRALFDVFFRRNVPDDTEGLYSFVAGRPYLTSALPPAPIAEDDRFVAAVHAAPLPRRGRLDDTAAGRAEYLAVPVHGPDPATGAPTVLGVFVVAEFPQRRLDAVDGHVTRVALALLTVLGLAAAAAHLVAGRVLAPLGEAIETAGASLQAQRDLVSDAGHELRTPLTIVCGHLELMTDDPVDREQTLALVTDELGRMSRLVEDLLLLATSERPDFLDRRRIAVGPLVREVLVKARALGPRDWRLDGAVDAELHADPQRLTQALVQLASNAVQHTEVGQVVAVGAGADARGVRLWVRDEGEGIAPGDRDRVFDRFARAAAAPRGPGGSGLGLSIVRAIAEAHGGAVALDSEVGVGSTFSLLLPHP